EANHDVNMLQVGPYPYPLKQRILGDRGHLSNERAGSLLSELLHDKLQTVMLGHLSKENNLPELAYESVRVEVTMNEQKMEHPIPFSEIPLYVAKRDEISRVINIA
ncbi:MAG: MBL fold metallo-hydrolase, partial [Lachnospiraceae bacterium]|nr:MBL fold metallo-hydrolase [Lachnospiraceae bacterium]